MISFPQASRSLKATARLSKAVANTEAGREITYSHQILILSCFESERLVLYGADFYMETADGGFFGFFVAV